MDELANELEQQKDRITLYNDMPTKDQLVAMLTDWAKQIREEAFERDTEYHHKDSCEGSELELQHMREELSGLLDKLRAIKEMI